MGDLDIPSIESSIKFAPHFLSVTERYFTSYYTDKGNGSSNDDHQLLLLHSNRICLITLADSHPVIKEKKEIGKVDFQVRSYGTHIHFFSAPWARGGFFKPRLARE